MNMGAKRRKKLFPVFLCLCMVFGTWPFEGVASAAKTSPEELSQNEEYGFTQVLENQECGHIHDRACGYAEEKLGQPCKHEQGGHDESCGYAPSVDEIPCDMACSHMGEDGELIHATECAFVKAKDGIECSHMQHDGNCGYLEAEEGAACVHVHDEECGFAEPETHMPQEVMKDDLSVVQDAGYAFEDKGGVLTIQSGEGMTAWQSVIDGSTIVKVVVQSGVNAVPANTFKDCQKLESVELPASVSTIGEYAFWNCTSLLDIRLPAGLTSVGEYAFMGCHSLEKLTFPKNLSSIGKMAFYGCIALSKLLFSSSRPPAVGPDAFSMIAKSGTANYPNGADYSAIKELFPQDWNIQAVSYHYDADLQKLTIINNAGTVQWRESIAVNEVVVLEILEGVTTISDQAFKNCINLMTVELPESVSHIGEEAFNFCSSLECIDLPTELTVLETSVFSLCMNLKNVNLPAGLKIIKSNAFGGCMKLELSKLPKGLTTIEDEAFLDCKTIKIEELPSGLTTIGAMAFSFCSGLQSLTLPASLTTIGEEAFYDCENLTRLTFMQNQAPALGKNAFAEVAHEGALYYSAGADGYDKKTFADGALSEWEFLNMLAPSMPLDFAMISRSFGATMAQITLSWSAPKSDGGAPIQWYEYNIYKNGEPQNWKKVPDSDASTASFIVKGLLAGTGYTVWLRAVNAVGSGDSINGYEATPVSQPSPPQDLRAVPGPSDDGTAQVVLSWSAPLHDGGESIKKYEYALTKGQAVELLKWQDMTPSDASTSSFTVTGLLPKTNYNIYVRAENGVLGGNILFNSSKISFTTPEVFETIPPEGAITIGTNRWTEFVNPVTFDLFFREKPKVSILAADNSGGPVAIEYFHTSTPLSLEEVAAKKDGWIACTDEFLLEFQGAAVVYARLTDAAGNTTYLGTAGMVFDDMAPKVRYKQGGKGEAQEVAEDQVFDAETVICVEDAFLKSVTLNEEPQQIADRTSCEFTVADNGQYTVAATDMAGNVSTCNFSMEGLRSSNANLYGFTYRVDNGGEVELKDLDIQGNQYFVELPRDTPRDAEITVTDLKIQSKAEVIEADFATRLCAGQSVSPVKFTVKPEDNTAQVEYEIFFCIVNDIPSSPGKISGMGNQTYGPSQSLVFSVTGSGMDNEAPVIGDERYVPLDWSVAGTSLTGSWGSGPYIGNAPLTGLTPKQYKLNVQLEKQRFQSVYDRVDGVTPVGGKWEKVKASSGEDLLIADFTVVEGYTLAFDTDGGKPVPPAQTLAVGTIAAAVADPSKSGYTFLGWYDGETKVDPADFPMPARHVILTARWEEKAVSDRTYTLTVINGTDVTSTGPYGAGEQVSIRADAPAGGMLFDQWVSSGGGGFESRISEETLFTMPSGNVTVTAKYKRDKTAPTGEIAVKDKRWSKFLNTITFGLFFKDTQEVSIAGWDDSGQNVGIAYHKTDSVLSLKQVKTLEEEQWTVYSEKFDINADAKLIIYARLADGAGNVAYISSDGMVLDKTLPVFSLNDGKSYSSPQTLTVSDDSGLASVTLGGTEQLPKDFNGRETSIALHSNGRYIITAMDRAGNKASITVTIAVTAPAGSKPIQTAQSKPSRPAGVPETGDTTSPWPWMFLLLASAGTGLRLNVKKRKNKMR